MKLGLRPNERPDDGLHRLADVALDSGLAAIAAALADPDDAEASRHAVHEARKTCKNLRALLRAYRPGLGKTYKRENAALRDAARVLSAWRDAQVLPETCAKLQKSVDDAEHARAIAAVASRLAPPAADDEGLGDALGEAAARLQAIRDRTPDWRVKQPHKALARGLAQTYAEGRDAQSACRPDGAAEPWHEWRKRVKNHWVHARLLAELHPAGPAYVAECKRLGDQLGAEHDLTVLRAHLADLPGDDARTVSRLASEQAERLRAKSARRGDALYRLTKSAVRRLARALVS